MQNLLAQGTAYVTAFFSNPVVWYVLIGAASWELIRWLIWRRPKSALSEQQILNRVLLAFTFLIALAWIAMTYRFYWMDLPGWHGGAIWCAHIVFTILCAIGVAMLFVVVEDNSKPPKST